MSIFDNANLKVQSYKPIRSGRRKLDTLSEGFVIGVGLENKRNKELREQENIRLEQMEKRAEEKRLNEAVIRRQINAGQVQNKMIKLTESGKVTLFKDILFEVFRNALLIDEDFVNENYNALRSVVDTYVDNNGGYKILTDAATSTNSYLLKKIKSICESIVTEVCKRKIKETKIADNDAEIDFSLNEEEAEKFDYEKDKINLDQISDLVKQKVLTVVLDEKAKKEKDEELSADIEQELMDNEEVVDDKSINEAMNKILLNKLPIEESTLFDSLMRNIYKETLKENQAITQTDHAASLIRQHDRQGTDPNLTLQQLNDAEDVESLDPDEYDIEKAEINMDLIMAEAITQYTLMETLYTLKLENYTRQNIKKLTEKLLNN